MTAGQDSIATRPAELPSPPPNEPAQTTGCEAPHDLRAHYLDYVVEMLIELKGMAELAGDRRLGQLIDEAYQHARLAKAG